jgi:hypothetical protein
LGFGVKSEIGFDSADRGWNGRRVESRPDLETVFIKYGSGDQVADAALSNNVVLKTAGPWASGVVALLRHLESVGFDGATCGR